jgi:hypothetical protein
MKRKEIDKIWTQAALNTLDFDKIMHEKGWVKSTLAQYCGICGQKMNHLIVGYEPEKEEMMRILENLKGHGLVYQVRQAIEKADEAVEGIDYDVEMYGEEDEPGFEGNPDDEKLPFELVGKTEELQREAATDGKAELVLIREFSDHNPRTGAMTLVNVYQIILTIFANELTKWLVVTDNDKTIWLDSEESALSSARGELMRGDKIENDNRNISSDCTDNG